MCSLALASRALAAAQYSCVHIARVYFAYVYNESYGAFSVSVRSVKAEGFKRRRCSAYAAATVSLVLAIVLSTC